MKKKRKGERINQKERCMKKKTNILLWKTPKKCSKISCMTRYYFLVPGVGGP